MLYIIDHLRTSPIAERDKRREGRSAIMRKRGSKRSEKSRRRRRRREGRKLSAKDRAGRQESARKNGEESKKSAHMIR